MKGFLARKMAKNMKLRPKFIRKKQNDVISAPVTPPIKQSLPDYYA